MKGYVKICFLAFCLIYLLESVVLSVSIGTAVRKSNETFGEENPYETMVSDAIYKRMSYRDDYPISMEDGSASREVDMRLGPVAVHWFTAGKAFYLYFYEVYDGVGELQGGSWRIPVTISYSLGSDGLIITDYYEPI